MTPTSPQKQSTSFCLIAPALITGFLVVGCVPDTASGSAETAGSTTAMDTGTGGLCDTAESFCALDGRCWTRDPGWTAWALELTSESIQDLIDVGSLIAPVEVDGGTCWTTNQGTTICQIVTECSELAAIPVSKIPVIAGECEFVGAWWHTITTAVACWGVFGELAGLLDSDPG